MENICRMNTVSVYHVSKIDLKPSFRRRIGIDPEGIRFKNTIRKCTVSSLLSYLMGAAVNGRKSFHHSADVRLSTGLVSLDYSSLSKKISAIDYIVMKQIFKVISRMLNRHRGIYEVHTPDYC